MVLADFRSTNDLDLNYLHQLSGNDKDFERQILNQFLEQLPAELSQLENSIKADDFETIRRTAHSLKSTVGYVGLANDLHPYLEKIERDAVAHDAAHFDTNYSHVKFRCDFAIDAVKSLLDKGLV